jgi:hypothetical protein
MTINSSAPAKCSKSIAIHGSSQQIWSVMTDINKWPQWQKDIRKARIKGELSADTKFDWKTGGITIHSKLHTVAPFMHFGWTGKSLGIYAIHNWSLRESGSNTIVNVEESMEGILVKLFRKTFNMKLEKGMLAWLEYLKKECER